MLTAIPAGKLATAAGAAAAAPAAPNVAPDVTLAQLDIIAAASGGAVHAATGGAVDPFVFRFSIFVMAIFVGYYVVWSVTPALHTPLMSVTNAISGVVVVGALVQVASDDKLVVGLSVVAILLASINVFGGFAVTRRMLAMFSKGA